jgi:methionyl-tRNA synthetase
LASVSVEVLAAATEAWDAVQPSVALDATWRLIREANALLEATEPWKADPGPEVDGVLGDALEVLRLVAVLASPATPDACAEVWRRIGLDGRPDDQRLPVAASWGGYPGGLPVEKGPSLFPRLKAD